MSRYLRPQTSNSPVFSTVCLAVRGSTLLIDNVDLLRRAVAETRQDHPFDILAWVVLPDHIHSVWKLPMGDKRYGLRWGAIKSKFSRSVLRRHGWPKTPVDVCAKTGALERTLRKSHLARRELGIWQRRFWEHHCRDAQDLQTHIRYCWGDPVKHGLVARPTDWAASSIHRDIRQGRVDPQWSDIIQSGSFGEAA